MINASENSAQNNSELANDNDGVDDDETKRSTSSERWKRLCHKLV